MVAAGSALAGVVDAAAHAFADVAFTLAAAGSGPGGVANVALLQGVVGWAGVTGAAVCRAGGKRVGVGVGIGPLDAC